jgi:putative membrane protein (TIGR04086 family)
MLKTSNQMSKPAVNESMSLVAVLKGILAAYIITIPAFMLFALILSNTDYPQKLITPAVVITTVISVLTAGAVSTRGLKNKGWLNGSIVGFIYMLILYLLSSLIYRNFSIDNYVVTMTVIGILTGAIGGIIGINIKKSSKYKRAGI